MRADRQAGKRERRVGSQGRTTGELGRGDRRTNQTDKLQARTQIRPTGEWVWEVGFERNRRAIKGPIKISASRRPWLFLARRIARQCHKTKSERGREWRRGGSPSSRSISVGRARLTLKRILRRLMDVYVKGNSFVA